MGLAGILTGLLRQSSLYFKRVVLCCFCEWQLLSVYCLLGWHYEIPIDNNIKNCTKDKLEVEIIHFLNKNTAYLHRNIVLLLRHLFSSSLIHVIRKRRPYNVTMSNFVVLEISWEFRNYSPVQKSSCFRETWIFTTALTKSYHWTLFWNIAVYLTTSESDSLSDTVISVFQSTPRASRRSWLI